MSIDESNCDPVEVVIDFWDVPREGVAIFERRPHYFKAEFDDALDDYSGIYMLVPLDDAAAAAVRADWEKWLQWRRAFDEGAAPIQDMPRIAHRVAAVAATISETTGVRRARATFHRTYEAGVFPQAAFIVEWDDVE